MPQYTDKGNTHDHKINTSKTHRHTSNKADNHFTGNHSSANYFLFANNLYQPEKGISMGSHISNTIAEIFLQHRKHTKTITA